MDAKTRAKFLEVLPTIYKRALAESILVLRHTRWSRANRLTLQDKALSLLNEAITRTLDGTRTWDPERVPDLHYFLREAVRSILSAELESPHADDMPIDTLPNIEGDPIVRQAERPANAEEQLIAKQAEATLVAEVLEAAGGDPILEKVVGALIDGCENSSEIAEQAGLDIGMVYQSTRKLRRRIESARRKAQP